MRGLAPGAGPTDGRQPPGPGATATARPRSGVVIGRYRHTVVVTVHGELDLPRAAHLGGILADLIDGQGNLSLLVDLHDASAADAEALWVFTDAAERARRHGGAMTLGEPPALLRQALRDGGLGHLVGAPGGGAGGGPAFEATTGTERQVHLAGHSPSKPTEGNPR